MKNKEIIESRVTKHALLFIQRNQTIRSIAKKTGYSKSTVYLDLTQRLKEINNSLFLKVKEVLEYNKKMAPIRGGQSTKNKLERKKRNGTN